jgi:hypothetical protein
MFAALWLQMIAQVLTFGGESIRISQPLAPRVGFLPAMKLALRLAGCKRKLNVEILHC